ncbi:unnamed protein product, partial [Didymodactylos carnosus]
NSNDTLTYKVCSLLLEAMNNINGFAKQLWFVLFQTDETDKHFLDKYNLKPQQQNNILMSILKSCTKFDHLHDGSSCPVAWQLLANLFEVMKYENFDWSTIWPKLSLAILDVLNYSINFDEHLLTWEQTKIKLEIEQFIKTHQKLIEKCLYDQLSHNPFCSQGIFDVATDNWSHDGLDVVLRCSKLLMKTMPCIDSPVQKRALAQCFIAAMRSNNCNLAKQSLKLIHHPQFSLISFDELFSVIDDTQCSPDIIYHPSPSTLDDMSKLKNELPSCSSTTSVSVDFARITTAFCKELESRSTDDIDQNELECRQSMIKQIKAVLEKLRDELGKVKQERDDLDSCLEQFQTQLHNAEDEKTKLHAEIDYLKELVETKNQRIKKVEQERESIVSVIKGVCEYIQISTNMDDIEAVEKELSKEREAVLKKLTSIWGPQMAQDFVFPKTNETRQQMTIEDLKLLHYDDPHERLERLRSMEHYRTTTEQLDSSELEECYQSFVRDQLAQHPPDNLEYFVRNHSDIDKAQRYLELTKDHLINPQQSHLLFKCSKLNEDKATLLRATAMSTLQHLNDDQSVQKYFAEKLTQNHPFDLMYAIEGRQEFDADKNVNFGDKHDELKPSMFDLSKKNRLIFEKDDKKYRVTFLKDYDPLKALYEHPPPPPPSTRLIYGRNDNVNLLKTNKSPQALLGLSHDYSLFSTENSTVQGHVSQTSNIHRETFPPLSLSALKEYRPSITPKLKQRTPSQKQQQQRLHQRDFIWKESIPSRLAEQKLSTYTTSPLDF